MEVYWFSGSAPAWRVLLTLAVKNAAYDSCLIEASKQEHKSPAFLALNPRGKVPALRDGDTVLSESLAIMAYLDRQYPEPPLFGQSADDTGHIWRTILDFEFQVCPLILRVILPIFFGEAEVKAEDIKAASGHVSAELESLNTQFGNRDWLVGDAISAADITIYPFVEALLRAAGKPGAAPFDLQLLPFGEAYPALEKWRARIAMLPGYDASYPPHWRAGD